jgi:hypothetical protein
LFSLFRRKAIEKFLKSARENILQGKEENYIVRNLILFMEN